MSDQKSGLFGIAKSNRDPNDHWGKNQFNSSFPVSLACYMKHAKIPAVFLAVDESLKVKCHNISIDDVFRTNLPPEELFFSFESKFQPYQRFAYDDIGNIDLVIKHEDKFLTPLEIKLTVLPDNTTVKLPEEQWGSEIVLRPDSTKYCGLGILDSLESQLKTVRSIIEPVCHNIKDWGNRYEIAANKEALLTALDKFQSQFYKYQKPFLMQPVWKTEGQSPQLAENAFDIFIWSDFALCRLFLDRPRKAEPGDSIDRLMRSAARFARFLYEGSTKEKVGITTIYTEMTHGLQTDKEFALSGRVTSKYMGCSRLLKPKLPRSVLREIICDGGQKKLRPERRFDQTLFFTAEQLFEELI